MDLTSYLLGKNSSSGGGGGEFTIEDGEKWYNIIEHIDKITINTDNWEAIFSSYLGNKLPEIDYHGTITNLKSAFSQCGQLKSIDLSKLNISYRLPTNALFQYCNKLAVLDISGWKASDMSTWEFTSMFSYCGSTCLQSDGAYADGIPYVYVKDNAMQNWVLTKSNGHPSTWTTDNVVIKE